MKGTVDGSFRVMCQKQGAWPQSRGKHGVEWPTCDSKPQDICEPVIKAPNGYVDDFERTLYVEKGIYYSSKLDMV